MTLHDAHNRVLMAEIRLGRVKGQRQWTRYYMVAKLVVNRSFKIEHNTVGLYSIKFELQKSALFFITIVCFEG
jgi:hypothetical protein